MPKPAAKTITAYLRVSLNNDPTGNLTLKMSDLLTKQAPFKKPGTGLYRAVKKPAPDVWQTLADLGQFLAKNEKHFDHMFLTMVGNP